MVVWGIDPGKEGAVAITQDDVLMQVLDMPVSEKLTGKGKQVSAYELAQSLGKIMDLYGEPDYAVIEATSAMPGQGVTSMYSFGRAVGMVEGVLAGLAIPVRYVRPQAWKKHWGLTGKDKDAARTLVLQLYPSDTHLFSRKKDCGRADAVLIARTPLP